MSDPGNFREIVRTVRIEYPIPYVAVVLASFSLACLGITAILPAQMIWVAGTLSVLAGIGAIGLPVYAMLRRPELLRSEQHSLVSRAMDIMLDKSASEEARSKAGQIVEGAIVVPAVKVAHKRIEDRTEPAVEDENE